MTTSQRPLVAPITDEEIARAFGVSADPCRGLLSRPQCVWPARRRHATRHVILTDSYADGSCHIDDELQSLHTIIAFDIERLLSPSTPATCRPKGRLHDDKQTTPATWHRCADSIDRADVVCDVASAWHSERPPYHYAELIELALTDKSLLTVRQIYSWIKNMFPYYRKLAEHKWQPAIRHTLTTNASFAKAEKTHRGHMWAFLPATDSKQEGGCNNHWKKQKIAEYTRSVFDKDDVIARDVTTRDVTRGCERYYVDDEPPVSAHYVLDTDRLYPYDHVTASRYATAVNYLMPSQAYLNHVPQDLAVAESGLMDNCGHPSGVTCPSGVLSDTSIHSHLEGGDLFIDSVHDFIHLHASPSQIVVIN